MFTPPISAHNQQRPLPTLRGKSLQDLQKRRRIEQMALQETKQADFQNLHICLIKRIQKESDLL